MYVKGNSFSSQSPSLQAYAIAFKVMNLLERHLLIQPELKVEL